ncbi:MAG: winged helix-turn-helix domain-containing protein [Candidatus Aenigmatarchaeota archaeon]
MTYLLKRFYKVTTFKTKQSRIPTAIFKLDKALISHFLAGFIDDEFTFTDSSACVNLANRLLLEDFKRLFKNMGFLTGSVKKYNKYYYLSIHGVQDFIKLPITHPNKISKIEMNLNRNNTNKYAHGLIKTNIINMLRLPISANEIRDHININSQTIRRHLRQLEKQNFIKISNKRSNTKYWIKTEV